MKIEQWNSAADGELTEEKLRQKLAAESYQVSREVYPAGTRFPERFQPADKISAVLAGEFKVSMGSESTILRAGDWVLIPHGTPHSIEVVGDQAVTALEGVKVFACCAGI